VSTDGRSDILVTMIQEHGLNCTHRNSNCPSPEDPCGLCSSMSRDTLVSVSRLEGARSTIDLGIALCPGSTSAPYEPYVTAGFRIYHQRDKQDERRILSTFESVFTDRYEHAVLLRHGVPNLPQDYISTAFSHLREGTSLVVGPLSNGSFYLLGMNRQTFFDAPFDLLSLFECRRDVKKRMKEREFRNIPSTILPEWYQINSYRDLRQFDSDYRQGKGYRAAWTRWTSDRVHGAL
jgi:glycosyltransferase A (GT-A) superfamily protein (DUF2064 family)